MFERDKFIMLMHESGGPAVAFVEGEQPVWSPDGKQIAFLRGSCTIGGFCEHDIWRTTLIRDNERQVNQIDWVDDYDVSFNSKGDRIAFIRNTSDESYLVVSDLNGTSERFLSINAPVVGTSWSPDGTSVAFGCMAGFPSAHRTLCLADASSTCTAYFGCSLPALTFIDTGSDGAGDPEWSQDGTRIAFTIGCTRYCGSEATISHVYVAVIDVATEKVIRLAEGREPAWSPDGSQLVFVGDATSPGLRVYNFADGSVRQLTTNRVDKSPSWRAR